MTLPDHFLLLALLLVTAAMTGVIWMVQLVTYPQFLDVPSASFPEFHGRYTKRITLIVMPLMLLELGLSLFAAWHFRETDLRWLLFAGASLTVALWLITFLVQVPQHEMLSSGFSEPVIRALIAGNWMRTVLWTVRSALVGWALLRLS